MLYKCEKYIFEIHVKLEQRNCTSHLQAHFRRGFLFQIAIQLVVVKNVSSIKIYSLFTQQWLMYC